MVWARRVSVRSLTQRIDFFSFCAPRTLFSIHHSRPQCSSWCPLPSSEMGAPNNTWRLEPLGRLEISPSLVREGGSAGNLISGYEGEAYRLKCVKCCSGPARVGADGRPCLRLYALNGPGSAFGGFFCRSHSRKTSGHRLGLSMWLHSLNRLDWSGVG